MFHVKKSHRSGGKFGGTHTTITEAASIICKIAEACRDVTTISPGVITAGLKSVSGQRRVKLTRQGGVILLIVRGNITVQELRVYASNTQAAMLAIARNARDAGFQISFKVEND